MLLLLDPCIGGFSVPFSVLVLEVGLKLGILLLSFLLKGGGLEPGMDGDDSPLGGLLDGGPNIRGLLLGVPSVVILLDLVL